MAQTENNHKQNRKKKGAISTATLVVILGVLGVLYYIYLTNNSPMELSNVQKTEQEVLMEYDFENQYPKTVRDVVKLHCRYLKYVYNTKELDEKTLGAINNKMRNLYAEELLTVNNESKQLTNLKEDCKKYQEESKTLISYTLPEASQVKYATRDGQEYAIVELTYNLKIKTVGTSIEESYILIKDSEGKWRILGWQQVESDSTAIGD